MFDRDYVLNSDWYKERLAVKQQRDIALVERQLSYITTFRNKPENVNCINDLRIDYKISKLKERLNYLKSEEYIKSLVGTIGADPLYRK